MSNNASSAFAPETQRAPSYALQHQSVVGYTPTGVLGTDSAPDSQESGISLHTIPGQRYLSDPTLYLQLPVGSRVTQVVVQAMFPNDPTGLAAADAFNIGHGLENGAPAVYGPLDGNLNLFFKDVSGQAVFDTVMKDADFVNPASAEQGSVGYVSRFPDPEQNYVNLGGGINNVGKVTNLTMPHLLGAEFKVIISYVVVADTAESNLQWAINQARPSVRGA